LRSTADAKLKHVNRICSAIDVRLTTLELGIAFLDALQQSYEQGAAYNRMDAAMADQQSSHSTLRERVFEHVFVGEALRTLCRWAW
jgi:hypothetical protein